MTAETNGPAQDVDALPLDIEVISSGPDGMPPEWVTWAAAIERREDLRYRVARRPERTRLTEALADHSAERGVLDWTDETLDFVAQLRAGTDRPELHPQPRRRWSINRKRGSEGTAAR